MINLSYYYYKFIVRVYFTSVWDMGCEADCFWVARDGGGGLYCSGKLFVNISQVLTSCFRLSVISTVGSLEEVVVKCSLDVSLIKFTFHVTTMVRLFSSLEIFLAASILNSLCHVAITNAQTTRGLNVWLVGCCAPSSPPCHLAPSAIP